MQDTEAVVWLSKGQRVALWAFLLVTLLFGAVVEYRSVYLKRRMTDADDFFRAAWALRTGRDIYEVTDTNGWHYNYPPFLAIILSPLANPPPGEDGAGMLPYPLSVAIWYLLSVACLALGVHVLASTVEASAGQSPPPGCFRWWALRMVPIYVCLPSIGRTLSRGQTNLIVLLLLCGMVALIATRRSWWAGVLLAIAISIKLFPAYLLLYPLWKRDWRCVAGCTCGLAVCLIVIPACTMGPGRMVESYKRFYEVFLGPALGHGEDRSRADEITAATGTDSQAFMIILHNSTYPLLTRDERPAEVKNWVRAAHWSLAALCTMVTLLCGPRRYSRSAITELMFFGALVVIMIPISPISHTHYFVFALPLVMALAADAWSQHPVPKLGMVCGSLFAIHVIANVLSMLPAFESLKYLGLSLYGTLVLWVAGLVILRRRLREEEPDNLAPLPAL